jgi:hypothetical protein
VSTINNWLFNFAVVMVTPIMVDRIKWATYLVFAIFNASFIPIIYFFFPETKVSSSSSTTPNPASSADNPPQNRSLEEIDIIFAKGHTEGITYVRAAQELPKLDAEQIEEYNLRYGLTDDTSAEKGRAMSVVEAESKESREAI